MAQLPMLTVGWREWLAMPALGVAAIKAKVDTGAQSSSLHAYAIRRSCRDGVEWVDFKVAPLREHSHFFLDCSAPVSDERSVRSSNGRSELRVYIRTRVAIDGRSWEIDINLTDRTSMKFPMLLGREAMARRLLVDPARSYLCGRALPHLYRDSGMAPKKERRR